MRKAVELIDSRLDGRFLVSGGRRVALSHNSVPRTIHFGLFVGLFVWVSGVRTFLVLGGEY